MILPCKQPTRRSLIAGAASLGLLGGHGQPARAAGPIMTADGAFSRMPQRLVTLSGHAHAHLSLLGIRPVGTTQGEMYTRALSAFFDPPLFPEQVANADYTPDLERVARLKPDLVVCWSRSQLAPFGEIGECLFLRAFANVAEIKASARLLSRDLPIRDEVERRIASHEARWQAYRARIERPLSMIVMSAVPDGRLGYLRNDNAIIDALGAIGRAYVPFPYASTTWSPGSAELAHFADPDAIMLVTFGPTPRRTLEAVAERQPLWRELRAARNGKVALIDGRDGLHIHSLPTLSKMLDVVTPQFYPEYLPRSPPDADPLTTKGG